MLVALVAACTSEMFAWELACLMYFHLSVALALMAGWVFVMEFQVYKKWAGSSATFARSALKQARHDALKNLSLLLESA